jgi:hypothetical protein
MAANAGSTYVQLLLDADSFNGWNVIREDQRTEPFDPLTLVGSLMECEMPLTSAINVVTQFWEKATQRFPERKLSHSQIHAIIQEVLLEDTHADRTNWFSNYESMFSREQVSIPDEKDYVHARQPSEIRRVVLDLLANEFGLPLAHGTGSSRVLSRDQLDRIVE